MAHSLQQARTRNTSTTHHTKPSTLSSLLHTTLNTILPLLFFTTFVIASTIVLSYSLSLNQPVPTRFIVGVSAAFAALIGLSIFLLVWSRLQAVWRTRKAKNRAAKDVENMSTARPPRFAMTPPATTTASESEPSQTHTHARTLQQQQHHANRFSFPPTLPPSSRHPSPVIARPIPTYRGLPSPLTFYHHHHQQHQQPPPPPPRRGSIELSAITERSLESERHPSDHRPSPLVQPSTPHPTYHHPPHPAAQHFRRQPPAPYRSPSVASLPESLRAPGRGAEMPMSRSELGGEGQGQGQGQGQGRRGTRPGWSPTPELRSGAVQLPMPSVPEPLRFGASILGRGGGGEGEGIGGLGARAGVGMRGGGW